MFKKLKQKINEEQSPPKNVLSPQQAQVNVGERRAKPPGLLQDPSSSPSDRELLAGMIAEPAFLSEYTIFALDHSKRPKAAQVPSAKIMKGTGGSPSGSVNGDAGASPLKEESQSLAQKLQQRVSSVESLFRGPGRTEGLFRSGSRDNLVRSASRDSLNLLEESEVSGASAYDPTSDIESEAEDAPGNTEALSKEQLLHHMHRVEKSLANYRGKYSELVTAYRTLQRDKGKTQAILTQSQDKALRRIGELKEELQMDQQAKKHLQEEFDAALEEKDQMITVLQTQVALMKKRLHGSPEALVPPKGDVTQATEAVQMMVDPQSTAQVETVETGEAGGSGEPSTTVDLEVLQKRVRRQGTLLQSCKELISTNKERCAQLNSENETLQQQLQERLQELEKMKELHTTEKTKLITQLRDAKNLIEQLEQDKGMVIAETKRQMHETLEMKEEEISQLRSRLQQVIAQKEEIQEQREKSEKAAFEEVERALGVAQRAEEARRKLQDQMEAQMKEVERTSEEERKSLQQELTRVKQEVVTIMKKSSEVRIVEMERLHLEALANKDKETNTLINQAVEKCRKELLQTAQEKEQQASLALEEVMLQKSALQAECQTKDRELLLELESARTRILELESSLDPSSQEEVSQKDGLSAEVEEQRQKFEAEIKFMKEQFQQDLENVKTEQTETLKQQHCAAVGELVQRHKTEIDVILKEKEMQFHAHVEDMNQKTLEKLEVKQTELEALSAELNEIQKCKQQLEEKLVNLKAIHEAEFEERLRGKEMQFQNEIKDLKHQHEQSFGGMEKTLKEELNQLRVELEGKDNELKQCVLRESILQEDASKVHEDVKAQLKEMEALRCIAQSDKDALIVASAQLSSVQNELEQSKTQLQDLKKLLEAIQKECQHKDDCLQQKSNENDELQQKVQQATMDLAEKENSYAQQSKAMQEELYHLKKQLDEEKSSYEKRAEAIEKDMDSKLKSQESKMEKIKHKAKEIQEKLKKKLNEQEENAKAEFAKKEKEIQQKDQLLKEKILEMAQANSHDLSSAMTDLEANHKEQLEKLQDIHRHEQEAILNLWQEKLNQQEEEMQEKHTVILQEKVTELEHISQQLVTSKEEKEQVVQEVKNLKEELAMRETTIQKLQAEIREAAVKLKSLSEVEDMLRKQAETVEKNLNQALNERNLMQDQLSRAEETSQEKTQALSEELDGTNKKLKELEASRCSEGENLQRIIEEKTSELQNIKREFLTQTGVISQELNQCCLAAQATLNSCLDDLCIKVEAKISELQNRVINNQRKLCHLKNVILTKNDKICSLEKELQQTLKESLNLKNSLDQMALQQNAHSENLVALTLEKESLQKDTNSHSQLLSEKVQCIEKLDEENKSLTAKLNECALHINDLERTVDDLKKQLASSITEQGEAISLMKQEHDKEKQSLKCQMEETVERIENEKSLALEQVATHRNELSELIKKTESKFNQNHNTIKSLETKIEDMEKQIAEKDEHLQRLTTVIDSQSSKSELDQVLSEKEQRVSALNIELAKCTKRISQLEEQLELQTKEQEQLAAELQQHRVMRESEKLELNQHLQQAKEQGSLKSDLEEKLKSVEREVQNTKQELESQQKDFEREKEDILKSRDEALKAAEESAGKMVELKKKAEQKIGMIRKQLTSQIELKEQSIKHMQAQLEDMKHKQCEAEQKVKSMEEISSNLKEQHTKLLEQVHDEKQEKMNSMQKDKPAAEKPAKDKAADSSREREEEEAFLKLREVETRLAESKEQNASHQAEIDNLKEELFKQTSLVEELQKTCLSLEYQIKERESNTIQKEECSVEQTNNLLKMEPMKSLVIKEMEIDMNEEAWKSEKVLLVKEYELKLQDFERRLEEKNEMLKALENRQRGQGQQNDDCSEDKGLDDHLHQKLEDVESEKQKIQKDYARLQKDLRSLRKEHEKELEYLRKEMSQESEKKLKYEMEDLEMKHNSAIKQMMREFNTQMVLKEKELEESVKEAIEKAQVVEAHLIDSHREEAGQLQKIITQKEDDLKNTVQRYEEVLQSREEEMGSRVWEIQKELEELQQSNLDTPQSTDELRVQLAEKTSLLSEARLKEQEFQDRIHTLEDTMQSAYKNSVVTHLGNTFREPSHYNADPLTEPTEFEYLRKVMFEYMMGRETKTMAKVITSMLKFPPDKAEKVLEREDSRVMSWLR